jgi:hypothetical protein
MNNDYWLLFTLYSSLITHHSSLFTSNKENL